MEKQIVFRSLGQNLPFMIVTAGQVVDGQFKADRDDLPFILNECGVSGGYFREDEMFGFDPIIARKNIYEFLMESYHNRHLVGVDFYDGFMVFKYNCRNEGKEKTSEKE